MSTPTPPHATRRIAHPMILPPPPPPPPPLKQPPPLPPPPRPATLPALDVEVPRADPPAGYATGLAMLAAFLVLIGLLYVALVAFLAWLFSWHVYQGLASLGQGPYFIFHFPMAVLGGLLVCFLVKPVFFRDKSD